jgi:hypothetical protein
MDKIFGISIDELYWNLKVGKSKRRANIFEIRKNLTRYIPSPVFFLSTGRCGTKWFSELLATKENNLLHSPVPSFALQSPLVYKTVMSRGIENELNNALVKELFFTGREQYLRFSYKSGKRYIETNNYITFFAPMLAELFPDAKFVHLYRHPGEFVRSGLRRNYYTHENADDLKRPTPEEYANSTSPMSRIEKISWLWNATNQFIENFKLKHSGRCYNFNFNELNYDNVVDLFEFLSIDEAKYPIKQKLNRKVNVQKTGEVNPYKTWSDKEKTEVKSLCDDLSLKYKYTL